MTKEELKKANAEIKTIPLKRWDKEKKEEVVSEYAPVNERVKAFRSVYPTGEILTDLITFENGLCVFRAQVGFYDDNKEYQMLASGTAYEQSSENSYINKSSLLENCETSAVGRALGFAGFGIDAGIASLEEIKRANEIQENEVSKQEQDNFKELCRERGADYVSILKECGWQRGMIVDTIMLDEATAKVKRMPKVSKPKLEEIQVTEADPIQAFKKEVAKEEKPEAKEEVSAKVEEKPVDVEESKIELVEAEVVDDIVRTTPLAGISATKFEGKKISEIPQEKLEGFLAMTEAFEPTTLVAMKAYFEEHYKK